MTLTVGGGLVMSARDRNRIYDHVQVGTRAHSMNGLLQAVGFTRMHFRWRLTAPESGLNNVRLVFGNYYITSGRTEAGSGNVLTIDAAIEITTPQTRFDAAVVPITVPLTFGGSRTVALADGGEATTDPFNPTLPANSEWWVRGSVLVAANEFIPVGMQSNATGEAATTDSGATQAAATGAITGTAQPVGFGPISVFGQAGRRQPSVLILGDSFSYGQGDVSAGDGSRGMARRALVGIRGAALPSLGHFRGSDELRGQAQDIQPRKRGHWWTCTHCIISLGTNDVNNGRTLAQMQGDAQGIWSQLARLGIPRWHVRIPPRTTSTDAFATAVNQTPLPGFAPGGIREQFNTWLDTQVSTGNVAGVIDCNAGLWADAGTPSVWAPGQTTDGVHPVSAAHIAAATRIRAVAAMF